MTARARVLWTVLLAVAAGPAPAGAGPAIVVAGPAAGRHAETLPAMAAGARSRAAGTGVEITEVDDGCDAGRAEGAARLIAAMKPDLVIGHPCPAAAIAAARVYAEAKVLFVALGVRHPDLTEKRAGATVFRLAGRDDRQGPAAAEALTALAPMGRIAIVQDRTAYARGLTATITASLTARKLPLPVVVPIVAGRRDYDAELGKLKPVPPEAVFFAGYPAEAAVVLRGLRKAGVTAPLIASDANATDDFALAASALDSTQSQVRVMVRAPGSGGLDGGDLKEAASRAVDAWLAARDANPGDPASALAGGAANAGVGFDAAGDARIASFAAVPLVAGGWAKNANAGP